MHTHEIDASFARASFSFRSSCSSCNVSCSKSRVEESAAAVTRFENDMRTGCCYTQGLNLGYFLQNYQLS